MSPFGRPLLLLLLLLPLTTPSGRRPDYECHSDGSGDCKPLEKSIIKNHSLSSNETRYVIKDGFKIVKSNAETRTKTNNAEDDAANSEGSFLSKRGGSLHGGEDAGDPANVEPVGRVGRVGKQNNPAKENIAANGRVVYESANANVTEPIATIRSWISRIIEKYSDHKGFVNGGEGGTFHIDNTGAGSSEINSTTGRYGAASDGKNSESDATRSAREHSRERRDKVRGFDAISKEFDPKPKGHGIIGDSGTVDNGGGIIHPGSSLMLLPLEEGSAIDYNRKDKELPNEYPQVQRNTSKGHNFIVEDRESYRVGAAGRHSSPSESRLNRSTNVLENKNPPPKSDLITRASRNHSQNHHDVGPAKERLPGDGADGVNNGDKSVPVNQKERRTGAVVRNETALLHYDTNATKDTDLHQIIATIEGLVHQLLIPRPPQSDNSPDGVGQNYGIGDRKRGHEREEEKKLVENDDQESNNYNSENYKETKKGGNAIQDGNKVIPSKETINIVNKNGRGEHINTKQDTNPLFYPLKARGEGKYRIKKGSEDLDTQIYSGYGKIHDQLYEPNGYMENNSNLHTITSHNSNWRGNEKGDNSGQQNKENHAEVGININNRAKMRWNQTAEAYINGKKYDVKKTNFIHLNKFNTSHDTEKSYKLFKNINDKDGSSNAVKIDVNDNPENILEYHAKSHNGNTVTIKGVRDQYHNGIDFYEKPKTNRGRDGGKGNINEDNGEGENETAGSGDEVTKARGNRGKGLDTSWPRDRSKGTPGTDGEGRRLVSGLASPIQEPRANGSGSSVGKERRGKRPASLENVSIVTAPHSNGEVPNDSLDTDSSPLKERIIRPTGILSKGLLGVTYNFSRRNGFVNEDGDWYRPPSYNEDDNKNRPSSENEDDNRNRTDNIDSNEVAPLVIDLSGSVNISDPEEKSKEIIFDNFEKPGSNIGVSDNNTGGSGTRVVGTYYQSEMPNRIRVDVTSISISSPGNAISIRTGFPAIGDVPVAGLTINIPVISNFNNLAISFGTTQDICDPQTTADLHFRKFIKKEKRKKKAGLLKGLTIKDFLQKLDLNRKVQISSRKTNPEISSSSHPRTDAHGHIITRGRRAYQSAAPGPFHTRRLALKRDADRYVSDRNPGGENEANYGAASSHRNAVEFRSTGLDDNSKKFDSITSFQDDFVFDQISTTENIINSDDARESNLSIHFDSEGESSFRTSAPETEAIASTPVGDANVMTFSEVTSGATKEVDLNGDLRPNVTDAILEVSPHMLRGAGPPLVFDRAASLRRMRPPAGTDAWLALARLQVAAQFRDNILKVFAYLLFRPSDTVLDFTLYQALQDLYSAVRLRRVNAVDLVGVLAEIRYVDVKQQFVSIFRQMRRIVPRYLVVTCTIWEKALKTSFVDVERMLRSNGGPLVVDFLEDLDSRVLNDLKVTQVEAARRTPNPKTTLRYKSRFLEEVMGGLYEGKLNLTLPLTGSIMQNVQLRTISPDSEESLRFIADLMTQGHPEFEFSIQNVPKKKFYNHYKLTAHVLGQISKVKTFLDSNIVDAATTALTSIKMPDIGTYSPNHDKVVAVMETGQGRLDTKTLFERVLVSGEFPSDIVRASHALWRGIRQGQIHVGVAEKGFSPFQYATPLEMLQALLQRMRQRSLVPLALLNDLSAVIVHLRYKLAYTLMKHPIVNVPYDLAPIFRSFQTSDIPPAMRTDILIVWKTMMSEPNFDWEAILYALKSSESYSPRQNFKIILNCIIDQHLISDPEKVRTVQNLNRVMDDDGEFKSCSSLCALGKVISESTESSSIEAMQDDVPLISKKKVNSMENIDLDSLFQALDAPSEEDEKTVNLKTLIKKLIRAGYLKKIKPDQFKTKGELLQATLNAVLKSSEVKSNKTIKSWLAKIKGLVKLQGMGAQKWTKFIPYLNLNSTFEAIDTKKLSEDDRASSLTRVLSFIGFNSQRIQWDDLKNLSSANFLQKYFERLTDLPNVPEDLKQDTKILKQYINNDGPGGEPVVIKEVSL